MGRARRPRRNAAHHFPFINQFVIMKPVVTLILIFNYFLIISSLNGIRADLTPEQQLAKATIDMIGKALFASQQLQNPGYAAMTNPEFQKTIGKILQDAAQPEAQATAQAAADQIRRVFIHGPNAHDFQTVGQQLSRGAESVAKELQKRIMAQTHYQVGPWAFPKHQVNRAAQQSAGACVIGGAVGAGLWYYLTQDEFGKRQYRKWSKEVEKWPKQAGDWISTRQLFPDGNPWSNKARAFDNPFRKMRWSFNTQDDSDDSESSDHDASGFTFPSFDIDWNRLMSNNPLTNLQERQRVKSMSNRHGATPCEIFKLSLAATFLFATEIWIASSSQNARVRNLDIENSPPLTRFLNRHPDTVNPVLEFTTSSMLFDKVLQLLNGYASANSDGTGAMDIVRVLGTVTTMRAIHWIATAPEVCEWTVRAGDCVQRACVRLICGIAHGVSCTARGLANGVIGTVRGGLRLCARALPLPRNRQHRLPTRFSNTNTDRTAVARRVVLVSGRAKRPETARQSTAH